jgi:serine/threonine-protein kinase
MGSSDLEARLLREVQICRRLTHPNIVRMHDVGQLDGGIFITMELVQGQDLDELLKQRGALPLPYVKAVLCQVASGLAEAHALGIVHRDLKPSNLIVAERRVKILDFGIARQMAGDATRLTQTGHAIGTPVYMSPEQVEGKTLDGRSDLYSLGILAFNLLTGDVPFSGDNLAVIALAHLQQAPPDPRTLRPGLPVEWVIVLQKLLAKKPEDRFATAGALLKALTPLAEEEVSDSEEASQTVDFSPQQPS